MSAKNSSSAGSTQKSPAGGWGGTGVGVGGCPGCKVLRGGAKPKTESRWTQRSLGNWSLNYPPAPLLQKLEELKDQKAPARNDDSIDSKEPAGIWGPTPEACIQTPAGSLAFSEPLGPSEFEEEPTVGSCLSTSK